MTVFHNPDKPFLRGVKPFYYVLTVHRNIEPAIMRVGLFLLIFLLYISILVISKVTPEAADIRQSVFVLF